MPTRGPVDDRRVGLAGGGGSRRSGAARVEQVAAGQGAVEAEGGADEPGPGREPAIGDADVRVRHWRGAPIASPRARSLAPGRPHPLDALERLDRPDEHGGRRSGRLGDDVQTVVHPVDKVHVGPAGQARTSTALRAVRPNRAWDARSSSPM